MSILVQDLVGRRWLEDRENAFSAPRVVIYKKVNATHVGQTVDGRPTHTRQIFRGLVYEER